MPRDPRYDILFEPIQIGPVRARNRFYQVPHCTGFGHAYPNTQARHRGIKAEGGWGVVSTQACEIHYSSDHVNRPYDRIWDDEDIPVLARMCDEVHAHGSLAAVELGHSGIGSRVFYSRTPSIGPSSVRATAPQAPWQSRRMDKADIVEFRQWHRSAAKRAKQAGFDIVYVYAAHNGTLASHFLSRRYNDRQDEYGGSLENRARLIRELLIDTKEAVGDTCGVAFRFAVDELMGNEGLTCDGEGREVVELLAELPDLWDVNIAPWINDSITARFAEEGYQEQYISFVKKVTTKPVVGVGRFTSPDTMVSQIRRGIIDFIGAARPSIADPFLPRKIEEGRPEDIRECIGCNVCVSIELYGGPMQCTQNPTIGEEWRRNWHPEKIATRGSERRVLVVGGGPAGLECTLSLARRGYEVALAEASRELGGRVLKESRLPGLATWIRVRDYRTQALQKLSNVEVYRESRLDADNILDLRFDHVVIATGSTWRKDGIGGSVFFPVPGLNTVSVFTPDDIYSGVEVPGPVLVYDDDHYYLGAVLCDYFHRQGKEVTIATPLAQASSWTTYTMEQQRVQSMLMKQGIPIRLDRRLQGARHGEAELSCVHTGEVERIPVGSVVLVTSRLPNESLYRALMDRSEEFADHGVMAVRRVGDCLAPGTIAAAVFSGHEFARNLDDPSNAEVPFRRERVSLM